MVLVVDDNPGALRLADRALSQLGHPVDTVGSVAEAWRRLEDVRYDVVTTDLRMPGASGLDLLVELRTQWPKHGRS